MLTSSNRRAIWLQKINQAQVTRCERSLDWVGRRTDTEQYLVVNIGTAKQATGAASKTLNPEWKICLDLPLADVLLVECVCWDKDRFGKDYMGEFDIMVEDIFADGKVTTEVSTAPATMPSDTLMGQTAEMVQTQIEAKSCQEEKRGLG